MVRAPSLTSNLRQAAATDRETPRAVAVLETPQRSPVRLPWKHHAVQEGREVGQALPVILKPPPSLQEEEGEGGCRRRPGRDGALPLCQPVCGRRLYRGECRRLFVARQPRARLALAVPG